MLARRESVKKSLRRADQMRRSDVFVFAKGVDPSRRSGRNSVCFSCFLANSLRILLTAYVTDTGDFQGRTQVLIPKHEQLMLNLQMW
jgi:hypothetical protein